MLENGGGLCTKKSIISKWFIWYDKNTLKLKLSVYTSFVIASLQTQSARVQNQNNKKMCHCPMNYGAHCMCRGVRTIRDEGIVTRSEDPFLVRICHDDWYWYVHPFPGQIEPNMEPGMQICRGECSMGTQWFYFSLICSSQKIRHHMRVKAAIIKYGPWIQIQL